MHELEQKRDRRGALLTLGIVLLVMVIVLILENLRSILGDSVNIFGKSVAVLPTTSMLFTIIKKGAVYCLVAVSMNLLNGFTGLFSLGQAGFMLLGAYTYAIFTIPNDMRDTIYYIYEGSAINFSFQELFASLFGGSGFGWGVSLALGVLVAIICAGIVAAVLAFLIGLPVLRLKSDYLAIATLGFAEIIRAVFQWNTLGRVTNGANMLKSFPTFASFNVTNSSGEIILRLSAFVPILISAVCIGIIVLLIHSSYGRAFKAIREDEVSAEAMGINLAKHKRLSFCISSFFAGVSGALFAMVTTTIQAKTFTSAMTYEILLMVVIGGIGSVSGSCVAAFLYIACSEWWLRSLDNAIVFSSATAGSRIAFIVIFALIVIALAIILIYRMRKKDAPKWRMAAMGVVALALLGWLIYFTATGQTQLPFARNGFRMVVFSIVIMVIVLFFSRGMMGTNEFADIFNRAFHKRDLKAPEGGEADE